jgi:type I restriction enzyme S subunit
VIKTWTGFSLAELTEHDSPITYGVVKPGETGDVLFIRGGDLSFGEVTVGQLRTITKEVSDQYKRTVLRGGELLISLVGTPGQVGIAPIALAGANIARQVGLIRLKPENDKKFISYYLQSPDGLGALGAEISGAVQKVINLNVLRTVVIPLPPIPEQQHIVAILDQAFADIEKARANAEQNLKNARELFDSYLQQVFSQRGERWVETTLGHEVDLLTGYAFKSKDYTAHSESVPLIRGDNVIQGELRWDGVKRWPDDKLDEYAKYQLEEGDVVLAMDRTWVKAGMKYAKITHDDLPCLLVQRVARLRTRNAFDEDYLFHLLGSKLFENYVLAIQTGLGVPHISGKQIEAFEFQRPTLEQQKEIISNVNLLSKQVDRLKDLYSIKIDSLDELKKSLLQKAFSGELTKNKGLAA